MTIWIGVDEAGYGPNLGPLLISATVWHTAPDVSEQAFGDLAASVAGAIGDSKRVYRSANGLAGLERGVLAALSLLNRFDFDSSEACHWRDLWREVAPGSMADLQRIEWYRQYNAPLPVDLTMAQLLEFRTELRLALKRHRIALRSVQARAIFPEQFNRDVSRWGSKGEALTRWTLALVADILAELPPEPVMIRCDKHGARNRYAALLQHAFADRWITICREQKEVSIYRWQERNNQVEIHFTVHGEQFLPTALASMTAKLLRELALRAFNEFWTARHPGLKPTAGYPVDARRFRAEIAPLLKQLAIPSCRLWREK